MKRSKAVLLPILLTVLLLGASVSFPLVYFQAQNAVLLNSAHPRKAILGKIDPQAEEIYLVQAIQDLYRNGLSLDADTVRQTQTALQQAFGQQLEQMIAAGILDATAASLIGEGREIRIFSVNQNGHTLDRYMIRGTGGTDQTVSCHVQQEEKTGKLLYFGVGKQGQALAGGSVAAISKRYIQYLGLDALRDWQENEAGMISQKAQLQVFCLQTENAFLLQISPVGYYSDNLSDPLWIFESMIMPAS